VDLKDVAVSYFVREEVRVPAPHAATPRMIEVKAA